MPWSWRLPEGSAKDAHPCILRNTGHIPLRASTEPVVLTGEPILLGSSRMRRLWPSILWAFVPAAACEFEPPDDPACSHLEFSLRVEATPVQPVDLLIWIDDSPSMAEEQPTLAGQLPSLIRELLEPVDRDGDTRLDHPPPQDLNVGIVAPGAPTTSALPGCLGPDGTGGGCLLRSTRNPGAECEATYPPFQSWNAFRDDRTDAEQIANGIGCLATMGTAGCPFEQPFASVLRALTEETAAGGCNDGFLREGALLYIVWISDGDDGSASAEHPELFDPGTALGEPETRGALHPELLEPIDTFLYALRSLKPADDQNKIVLGMVVGVPQDSPACMGSGDELEGCLGMPAMQVAPDPSDPGGVIPSCLSAGAMATPPRRFVQLAQAFGSNAIVTSICGSDWRDSIGGITQKLIERLPMIGLPREPPLEEGECTPDCVVVETLFDDRPCPDDPACPASWCPAATEDDVSEPPPCIDPTTGAECRPFKRDLGVVTDLGGTRRRQCLMRAATRTWDATSGSCAPPVDDGWYYRPPVPGDPEFEDLATVWIQGESYWGGGFEPGSRAEVRCGWTTCDGQ